MTEETTAPLASRCRLRAVAGELIRGPPATGLLAAFLFFVLFAGLRVAGLFEPLELGAFDRLVLLRAADGRAETRLVQIQATEADIERFGWPLSDGMLADTIRRLQESGTRAVGIDIFRPAPIGPGSDTLGKVLAATRDVVWATRFAERGWVGIAAPAQAQVTGFSDVVLDPGGVCRRALLYLDDSRGQWDTAFPLQLALRFLASENIAPVADPRGYMRLGHVSLPPIDPPLGGYAHFDSRGYQILREFRAPRRIPAVTLGELLDGTVSRDRLAGRAALVGVVADSVKDSVITPLDARRGTGTAGVTLHALLTAQVLAHALDGLAPTLSLPWSAEVGLIALAVAFGACAGVFLRRTSLFVVAVLLGAVLLLVGGYAMFLRSIWLPVVPMTAALIFGGLIAVAASTYRERAQQKLLRLLFSSYVSRPIADDLWRRRAEFMAQGRPLPIRLDATVLFSDINDFTSISERLEPEALVRWLQAYMDAMSRLVEAHGGIVERVAGDGILAIFGAPIARRGREIADDAQAALRCASAMVDELETLNRRFSEEGLPDVRLGIGIYSGELVGCSLGSPERQQYSTVGDTTNTAARLTTLAKELMRRSETQVPCLIVIGETTRALVGDHVTLNAIGDFPLKGKHQPVRCYALRTEHRNRFERRGGDACSTSALTHSRPSDRDL